MFKIKSYFNQSNKGPMIIIIFILLCLYGFTMSRFLASGPSEGFSREVEIGTVKSGEKNYIDSHVSTLVLSDAEILVTAVDHQLVKLYKVSRLGKVIEEDVLDLNLFHAREISTSIDHEGILTIMYLEDDLYKVLIDLDTLEFKRTRIAEEVKFFLRNGQTIVFQHASDLYGMNVEDPGKVMPLLAGPIKSYSLDQDESTGIYHLMATINNANEVDLVYIQFNEDLEIEKNFLIEEGSTNTHLKFIRDLHVEEDLVTGIFVWKDPRYGENNLTVHRYDIHTSKKLTDYRRIFSIHDSPPTILDVKDDQVKILIQESVHYGVNCVVVLVSEDQETQITPLTKTKNLSLSSSYFEFGEDQGLVFFDLVDNNKVIYFASSNQDLVEKTTEALTINPTRIIGMFLMAVVLAALFSTVYYVLAVGVLPFLLLIIMNKFLPDFKNKEYVKSLVCAILHLALKISLIYYIIHVMGTFILRPLTIGNEPYIYIFMVFTSIISYYLMVRHYRWNREYESTITLSYLYFLFYEYIIFTLVVFIYIVTYMVIGKI
ncbi:hypothetical protein [Gudongella sp. DL1XJH-153]|uniref:hypothetical protein n=1 Tax=Gudongella sp. DL1XJH-153 TaxID=3409804 RepID=UPI003BB6F519